MQLDGSSSLCRRYRILQPNSDNLLFRGYLPQTTNQAYQLIKLPDKSIRHYLQYYEDIHDFLSIAQWRFQGPREITRYLYAQLMKPNLDDGGMEIQVFTDHMQLPLKDVRKLITSESLYFLVTCLKGYSQLLNKFKKVSINPQTIGLNSSGECIVWINRHLERNYPEYYCYSSELDVITTLITLLKDKGESTCQSVLNKIRDYAIRNKSTIGTILNFIANFTQQHLIRLPANLNYLLRQSRIIHELEEIQGQKTTRLRKRKCSTELSLNSNAQSRDNLNRPKLSLIPQQSSLLDRYLLSSRNIPKRNSCIHNRVFSSKEVDRAKRLNGASSSCFRRDSRQIFASNHRLFSKQSDSASNSETDRYRMKILSMAKYPSNPKSEEKVYFHPENHSKQKTTKTSQVQTIASLIDLQKQLTNRTLNVKMDSKKVGTHNSILSQFSNAGEDEIVPEEEQESERSSPQKGNNSNLVGSKNSKRSKKAIDKDIQLELSFGNNICIKRTSSKDGSLEGNDIKTSDRIRQSNTQTANFDDIEAEVAQQIIFKGNNWTKTVVGLLQLNTKLNVSVVEGTQKNIYLDDIKLEKLDSLKREMAQSLIPCNELVRKESNKH